MPGTVIRVVGREFLRQTLYDLWYADTKTRQGTRRCGHERIITGPTETNDVGDVSVDALIPPDAPSGTAEVWFAQYGNPDEQGPSAFFTIVGGNDCDVDVLYKGGSDSNTNLTPRPIVAGRRNDVEKYENDGLSTFTVKAKACVRPPRPAN